MKYFLHFIIFGIGTATFLLAWLFLDKTFVSMFNDSIIITSIAFIIGLCVGWVTDFLLVSLLPEKYK